MRQNRRCLSNIHLKAGAGKWRPACQVWPATAFSVAHGSIHENLQT